MLGIFSCLKVTKLETKISLKKIGSVTEIITGPARGRCTIYIYLTSSSLVYGVDVRQD